MIGKNGFVKGIINAHALVVANILELKAQGRIEGTITANELVVERKGVFIGESKVRDSKEIPSKDIAKDIDSKKKV